MDFFVAAISGEPTNAVAVIPIKASNSLVKRMLSGSGAAGAIDTVGVGVAVGVVGVGVAVGVVEACAPVGDAGVGVGVTAAGGSGGVFSSLS